MSRAFKPPSQAELCRFEERFCDRCHHGQEIDTACPIWARGVAHRASDVPGPAQWVADDDGPRCTAFAPLAHPLGATLPCPFTHDLFGRP